MKNKTVKLVLAVTALALVSGAYIGVKTYVSRQEQQNEENTEETTENVFSSSEDNIETIGFVTDNNEVVFEKEDDTWFKQDEKEFPVNQTVFGDAVSSISSVDSDKVIEDVEDLEQYGLIEPANIIKIGIAEKDSSDDSGNKTEDETEDKTENKTEDKTGDEKTEDKNEDKAERSGLKETILRIGDKNNSTDQYYVSKNEDEKTVYLVNSSVIEPFMKGLYEYAQKEDFPVITDTETVQKVSVTGTDEKSYMLEKEADTGFWNVTGALDEKKANMEEKADSAKVTSTVSALNSLAYASFVDYKCEDKSAYGLDNPYAVITVDYKENVDETDSDEESTGEEPEESDLDAETAEEAAKKSKTIDKQLVIEIGDESEDGGRYVSVNGSKQIYTMSKDSLAAFIEKAEDDFWDLTVSYLSVNRLESLDVEYSGKEYEINVSRETFDEDSEDNSNENGNENNEESNEENSGESSEENNNENAAETKTDAVDAETGDEAEESADVKMTYSIDGNEIDEMSFVAFYNKLINMSGQSRLTEEFDPETEPEMKAIFTSTSGEITDVEYYPYDTNFYAAVVGEKVYLVNKMNVKALFESFDAIKSENSTDEASTNEKM